MDEMKTGEDELRYQRAKVLAEKLAMHCEGIPVNDVIAAAGILVGQMCYALGSKPVTRYAYDSLRHVANVLEMLSSGQSDS